MVYLFHMLIAVLKGLMLLLKGKDIFNFLLLRMSQIVDDKVSPPLELPGGGVGKILVGPHGFLGPSN